MTDDGEQSRAGRAPKSRALVCTACRQSKVRCIGPDTEPCERCTRLGLDCLRDAKFRRQSKSRGKIAELEKQVQQLSSIVNAEGQSPQIPLYQADAQFSPLGHPSADVVNTGFSNQRLSFDSNLQRFDPGFQSPVPSTPNESRSCSNAGANQVSGYTQGRPRATLSQEIETVFLSAVQIDDLFQIFFDHYHPFLPFHDPLKSPDDYQTMNPCLFWAIISVASRRYRDDVTLLTALSSYESTLIWAEISKPPYTVATVQAIIILCTWPFPTTSTWIEPAVALSSVAINIAMQVGLHRPVNAQDFLRTKAIVNESEARVRTSTWAAANMTSQLIGAVVGQLPTAPFDWTVDQACQLGTMYTLPENLRFKLIISRFCDRVTKLMCENANESIGFQSPSNRVTFMASWENTMVMLENELNTLEHQGRQKFSLIDSLYYSAARVFLCSFYFFDSSDSERRKQGIFTAYKAACSYISLLAESDAKASIPLYLPYYFSRTLLTAACVLLKVLISSYAADVEDYEAGKKLLNQTILTMSHASVFNNDLGAKAIKLLAQMWHGGGLNRQSVPQLIIKSRLGASLTYDFIWTWRQKFGGVPQAYPSSSTFGSQPQESPIALSGFFQDTVMVDLDFLENVDWNLGVEQNTST